MSDEDAVRATEREAAGRRFRSAYVSKCWKCGAEILELSPVPGMVDECAPCGSRGSFRLRPWGTRPEMPMRTRTGMGRRPDGRTAPDVIVVDDPYKPTPS